MTKPVMAGSGIGNERETLDGYVQCCWDRTQVDEQITTTRRQLLISGVLTLGALGLGIGFANREHGIDNGDRIAVAATVGMITDVVRRIGSNAVAVSGLMGPGIDPHTYKPRASDITTLGDASIIFYGGLELEGRMGETFEKIDTGGVIPTIAVSEHIPEDLLIQHTGTTYAWDPHVWFDVSLWIIATGAIADGLSTYFPEHEAMFRANFETYRVDLEALDAWIFEQVERLEPEQRVLITAHDAFTYFGRRYGFEVLGVQGVSTASEAAAGDIQDLADVIVDRRIRAIFVESAVPPATIEAVQAAVSAKGWGVAIGGSLYADAPGAEGTPDGTYIGMVQANVNTIVGALLGENEGLDLTHSAMMPAVDSPVENGAPPGIDGAMRRSAPGIQAARRSAMRRSASGVSSPATMKTGNVKPAKCSGKIRNRPRASSDGLSACTERRTEAIRIFVRRSRQPAPHRRSKYRSNALSASPL